MMTGSKSGRKHVPDRSEVEILHQRYQEQAGWTSSIRSYLLSQLTFPDSPRILSVGCGTGVIIKDIQQTIPSSQCFGIDIDGDVLKLARSYAGQADYAQSDAFRLPFSDNFFDLIFCHFFLLWAKPLEGILQEIVRVLKPSAPFLAFAEPDYGGRIDFPIELAQLGEWQERSLQQQGAHTRIGRELASQFSLAGFTGITTGVLGGEWKTSGSTNQEMLTLKRDLSSLNKMNSGEVKRLLKIEEAARKRGTRTLFIPTFYAVGFNS